MNDQPFFRSDTMFDKNFKLNQIMRCLYNAEHLLSWEKNTKTQEFIPVDGHRSFGLNYYRTKKVMVIGSRDFVDKTFIFENDGKIYKYSSHIENCTKIKPIPVATVRGTNMFSFGMAHRIEDDVI